MNPYEKYQQQMVTTMTQGDMLLKLYDETLKQIGIAKQAMNENKIEEMAKALGKTEKIIRYLKDTLDHRFPVSANLAKLYDFFNMQIVMANVKKAAQPLNEIEPLIQELRDTFAECDKMGRTERAATAVGDVV